MSHFQDNCVAHPGAPSVQECQNCESGLCANCHLRSKLCRSCRRIKLSKVGGASLAALVVVGLVIKVFSSGGLSSSAHYGKHRFEIQGYKKALQLEPCNRQEAINLATTLFQANIFKETADFSENFIKECGDFTELSLVRFEALKGLGQWQNAIAEISKVIETFPNGGDYYAFRGLVYENTGEWDKAEADYKKTLSLRPNLIDVPLNLATAQERLGKTCDAVNTLKGVLAKAGDAHGRDDVFQRLVTLNKKGKCIAGTEKEVVGRAVVVFAPGAKIITTDARLNNAHSIPFIVDTGASYVTISMRAAKKLNLKLGPPIRLKTANGEATGHSALVDSIRIQGVEARNVPVVVLEGDNDNLLGLSFLSKFKLEMHNAQGTMTLQSRSVGVAFE